MKTLITKQMAFLKVAEDHLSPSGPVTYAPTLQEQDLIESARDIDVVIATNGAQITESFFANSPSVKLIAVPSAGYNFVDVAAATSRGIPVFSNSGVAPEPVADFTMGLILGITRKITFLHQDLRATRKWAEVREEYSNPLLRPGSEMQSLRFGVVGLGNIGRCVVGRLQGFGCTHIAIFDRSAEKKKSLLPSVQFVDNLKDLAAQSDVLTIHVPLTSETEGFISREIIAAMPKGAMLVNTSRGTVIDNGALEDALLDRHLSGAALDVFATEPLPADSTLHNLDNVIVTPHMAAFTKESDARRALHTAEQVLKAMAGSPPEGLVNPEAWDSFLAKNSAN